MQLAQTITMEESPRKCGFLCNGKKDRLVRNRDDAIIA
jgi:hypothetical protein